MAKLFNIKSAKASKKALKELSEKEQIIEGEEVKGGAFERVIPPTGISIPPKKQ